MPKEIYTARKYYSADNDPSPLKFQATRDGDAPLRLHLETASQTLDVTVNRDQFLGMAAAMGAILADWPVTDAPVSVTPLPVDPVAAVPAP